MFYPEPDYGQETPISVEDNRDLDYRSQPFAAAPNHLIPPPDYGFRGQEPKVDYETETFETFERPSEFQEVIMIPSKYKTDAQTRTVPTPEEPQEPFVEQKNKEEWNPIVPTPQNVPRHSYIPPLPPKDNFIAHSYLEDKDKINPSTDKHKSMRSHIRSIGVPVLPPIGGNDSDFFTGKSPAQNKAFIRHLENHRNFDTMKSLKSCENCPICKMMTQEEREAIQHEHAHHHDVAQLDASPKRRGDVRDLFAPETDVQWSRTKRSYKIKNEGEMNVDFREKVEVLNREGSHVLCRKTDGTLGWLPVYIVM